MGQAQAVVFLVLKLVVLGLAIVFAVETSRGDRVLTKIAKFLGLFISVIPIVGLIFYLFARGKKSGFGERCGGIALAGIALYAITRAV